MIKQMIALGVAAFISVGVIFSGYAADSGIPYSVSKFNYNKDKIEIAIEYLSIKDSNKNFKVMNDQIMKDCLNLSIYDKPKVLSDTGSFLNEIKTAVKKKVVEGLEHSAKCKMIYNANNIFSVKTEWYEMAYFAANGPSGVVYSNFDTQTGKQIDLRDCFSKENWDKLEKIGKTYFDKSLSADSKEYVEKDFLNKFYIAKDWGIKPTGIEFKYQLYEIGARPLGMPEFIILNKDVKELMDKDSLLYQYLYK